MRKAIDIIGQEFGLLKILKYNGSKRSGNKLRRYYLARCKCGNEKEVLGESVRKGFCRSCGCLRKRMGKDNPKWTGCGEINGNQWNYIQSRCNRSWRGKKRARIITLNLTVQQAWELFIQQERKCVLTGVELSFGKNKTASLDRIDSSGNYELGNVQWVHKDINLMKQSFSQEQFIEYCRMVVQCQANL